MDIIAENRHKKDMELVRSGEMILLFDTFPLEQVPRMTLLRIELLSANEEELNKKKTVYIRGYEKVEDWTGIDKFIVGACFGNWYLVRIL